jgi:hypothetical protein
MRRVLLALFLICAFPSAVAAEDAAARYQALVAAARQGNQPVDWQALRFAYAATPDFDPLGAVTHRRREKMFAAYAAGDDKTALAEATRILDENYTDIAAHVVSEVASHDLGDEGRSQHEHDIIVALLRSIRTGDGQTPATAFTVVSITEEYDYLHYLKYEFHQQALVSADGHAYDRFEVTRDGKSYIFYFLADRVLAAEAALLQPKP